MGKNFVRLYPIDIARLPWQQVAGGAPSGIHQKTLVVDPDTGSSTRFLRAEPQADMGILVHDHWEEVYVLEGSAKLGQEFHPAGTYTCKPPAIEHGPILTNEGFLNLEVRDFHRQDVNKPLVRLFPVDIQGLRWLTRQGAVPGDFYKTLASDPGSGAETLLFRVDPGTEFLPPQENRCEELYILKGSCKIGDVFYPKGSYVCWPSGHERGAFSTDEGLLALQVFGAYDT